MSTIPNHPPINHDDAWTDYRDTLAWYLEITQNPRKVLNRRRTGATASPRYVQRQARIVFLATLYRIAPTLSDDLLTPEFDALVTAAAIARRRWWQESGIEAENLGTVAFGRFKQGPLWDALRVANDAVSASIDAWQSRHYLCDAADPWFGSVVYWTAAFADGLQGYGLDRPSHMPLVMLDPDRYINVHDGRAISVDYRGCGYQVPLDIEDLKEWPSEPEDNYSETFPDSFGTFGPHTETVNAAEKRLMEALRPRLRRALEMIAADDREGNNAIGTVEFRKTTAFEWLARFQVGGETRGGIARELAERRRAQDPDWTGGPDHYTSHVGREILKIADLIGLTLRDA